MSEAAESSSDSYHPSSSTSTAGGYRILKPYNGRAQAIDCCTFITFVTLLALLVGAVPAVTTLLISLQPSLPTAAVHSSTVTLLNVSSSLVTATWDVTFSITNPNPRGFFYDRVLAYAAVQGVRVANYSIPTFRQPGMGTTANLTARFPRVGVVVDDCTGNGTVVEECGKVEVRLEVVAGAVYERWTWPERRNVVAVECEAVEVVFGPGRRRMEYGMGKCGSDGEWRRLKDKCRSIFWNYVYVAAMCLGILAFSL